jgi:uncharacterized SAM-binding protein YcdF (DUF218 family)
MKDTLRARAAANLISGAIAGALGALLLEALGFIQLLGKFDMPLVVLLAAIVGALISLTRLAPLLLIADGVVAIIYLLVGLTPLIRGPVDSWIRRDPPPASPLDVIVVLSSGLIPDSSLDTPGLDRLLTGIDLVHHNVAPQLLLTRFRMHVAGRDISTFDDQTRLLALGSVNSAPLIVDDPHNTHDEAVGAARLLFPSGRRRIAVVTSPMHTRRACATFEAAGFVVTCVPAREHDAARDHPATATDRLAAFRSYVYERLGMFEYRRRGWLRRATTSAPTSSRPP